MNPPIIVGTPGGSLSGDASWASGAGQVRAGAHGEQLVARVLHQACRDGQAVFHDLSIPGSRANIDHLVLGERELLIVDAKRWAPGRYWTAFGSTRRGLSRVSHADKKTLPMAFDKLSAWLSARGVTVRLLMPLMVVCPSSDRDELSLAFYRPAGARALTLQGLQRRGRRVVPRGQANVRAMAELRHLVKGA